MLGFAGSSMALFAMVWGLMCVLSSALVTETWLRDGLSNPEGNRPALASEADPRPMTD